MKKGNTPKRLFTVKEAAVYLGHTEWGIRTLIWRGDLPVVRYGRKQWLDRFDLDQWILRNKREP